MFFFDHPQELLRILYVFERLRGRKLGPRGANQSIDIVVEGLVANVCLSLGHLLEQISPVLANEDDALPMIAVKLELFKGKEVPLANHRACGQIQ